MKYGDIELLNSKISNLRVEEFSTDPEFTVDELSRIYFNNFTNSYKFNNGTSYVDLSLPANFSALINTLGDNWINADFTFNPTPFNNLHTISGLTSNNSLFDVILQLDNAINELAIPKLAELEDVVVPDSIVTGDILYFNNNGFTFANIDTIIENYSELKIANLKDVSGTPIDGGSLVYNATANEYNIIKTCVVIEDFFNTIQHSISHNLGVKYVSVAIVDAVSDTTINNAVIQYLDDNSLNITLPSAAKIVVILTIPYGS